jgi:hypothetical protein
MLVFLGPKRSWEFFGVFRKKSKKSEKMRFFRKKAYGLEAVFAQSRIIIYHAKMRKKCLEKNVKKKGISFFETFFLKWKLDIYFCPFLKLKKKFWKLKNFPFSPSRWNYLIKKWNYKNILEKREMRFLSSENKNWTFRGSFDKFLTVFHFIFAHLFKKTSKIAAFVVRRL